MQPIETFLGSFYVSGSETFLSSLPLRGGGASHLFLSIARDLCMTFYLYHSNHIIILDSSLVLPLSVWLSILPGNLEQGTSLVQQLSAKYTHDYLQKTLLYVVDSKRLYCIMCLLLVVR